MAATSVQGGWVESRGQLACTGDLAWAQVLGEHRQIPLAVDEHLFVVQIRYRPIGRYVLRHLAFGNLEDIAFVVGCPQSHGIVPLDALDVEVLDFSNQGAVSNGLLNAVIGNVVTQSH